MSSNHDQREAIKRASDAFYEVSAALSEWGAKVAAAWPPDSDEPPPATRWGRLRARLGRSRHWRAEVGYGGIGVGIDCGFLNWGLGVEISRPGYWLVELQIGPVVLWVLR